MNKRNFLYFTRSNSAFRHCEQSEAIQSKLANNRIASGFALAMTNTACRILFAVASLMTLACTHKAPVGEYSATTIADGLVSLDGEQIEDVWQLSKSIRSFTNPWNSKICPETSLSMLKDSKYLYFFFDVKDDDLVLEDDFSNERDVEKEDRVELFMSKDKEMNEYSCFDTDAKGRVLSYRCSYYRNFDFDWDVPVGFVVAGHIRPDGYSVEGAIPVGFFKDLLQNDEFIYFGAYRAEFSKKDGVTIENWLTWNDPSTAKPDFHVPLTLGKLYHGVIDK
jgi:hypothetical protein